LSKICRKEQKKRGKEVLLLTMSHTPFLVLVPVLLSVMLLLRGMEEGSAWGTGTEERKACYQAMVN